MSDEGAEPALVALSGVDGAERWALDGFAANSGAAIIDVQSDGVAEIVALDISGRLTALAWDGAEVWKSDEKVEAFGAQPLVTDLDGDGWPEVVAGDGVFEGDDGALRFRMTENLKPGLTLPAVGDLDLDGAAEIYLGQYRYAGDGSAAEVLPFANATGQFLAVADVDGTPEGELVVASSGFVQLRRHDGELVVAVPNVTTNAGPPCVADFDGDGVSEIVKPGGDVLTMLELTGELGWTQPTQDLSGLAGCSGFDLDGDGAAEVLYADESVFQILDGRTGTPLAGHFIGYTSSTVWAYPVVADVDGDGAAEIVLVHDDQDPLGPSAAVTVVGHPTAGWMPAGPHWPVHDFSGSNVGAGGKVASSGAAPPWQTGNLHRARAGLRPRLGVEIVGGCWTACEPTPTLGLGMQVHNDGTEAVEGLTWHLFDPTARSAEALAAGEISGPLEPGARSPMAHAGAELPGSSLELRVFGVGRHSGALVEAWAIWTAEQDGCPETAEEAQ